MYARHLEEPDLAGLGPIRPIGSYSDVGGSCMVVAPLLCTRCWSRSRLTGTCHKPTTGPVLINAIVCTQADIRKLMSAVAHLPHVMQCKSRA
jgi:hypothetical protein